MSLFKTLFGGGNKDKNKNIHNITVGMRDSEVISLIGHPDDKTTMADALNQSAGHLTSPTFLDSHSDDQLWVYYIAGKEWKIFIEQGFVNPGKFPRLLP